MERTYKFQKQAKFTMKKIYFTLDLNCIRFLTRDKEQKIFEEIISEPVRIDFRRFKVESAIAQHLYIKKSHA